MTTTISDTRHAVGWTVRDLAENLGVAPSTITRMEQAELAETIQIGTLKRALGVMGRGVRLEIINNRREERVAMELHRSLAHILEDDPTDALGLARENLDRLRSRLTSPLGFQRLARWDELLQGSVDVLISAMLSDSSEGRELRRNSPFAGALTQDQRLLAIHQANRSGLGHD